MPKYRVRGKYVATYRVVLVGDETIDIDAVVEADSEKWARTAAIDEATDDYAPDTYDYEEVDWEIEHDDTKGLTVKLVNDDDPEYQKIENEQLMRRLGPAVAPPLLEVN